MDRTATDWLPRRRRRPGLAGIVALALLGAGLLPAAATAAPDQEAIVQDDNSLIFNSTAGTARTLDALAALGVDRVRVSVFWATVAPDARSQTRPTFDAADPDAYPEGAWGRYDQVVRMADERGIAVTFNITSPAPLWATGDAPREDLLNVFEPDAQEFGRFVQAVGARYAGGTRAPRVTTARVAGGRSDQPPACAVVPAACPAPDEPAPAPAPAPEEPLVPRVTSYSIWNEPNQGGWLTPQWTGSAGREVEASPRIYRALVDAAWEGLQRSGHAGDAFLIGETAPRGRETVRTTTSAMAPLRFVRALYCVDDALVPYRGAAATARGCPADGDPSAFAAAHPGLFSAGGFAHHPYQQAELPTFVPRNADWVTISSLSRLTVTLRRLFAVYGRGTAGLPLHLTEFGYATNPPNPAGISLRLQSAFLNVAEFIAAANPEVRTMAQFLLVDDAPRPGRNGVTEGYGATSQTGLLFLDGTRKPSFTAFQLPIDVPAPTVSRRGAAVRVHGLVRPQRRLGSQQRVAVRFRATTGPAQLVKTITTAPGPGRFSTLVRLPSSGFVQLAWQDPRTGETILSRSVTVRVTSAAARRAAARRRAAAARRAAARRAATRRGADRRR